MIEIPAKCQSKEDGVCRLPIGSCTQCETGYILRMTKEEFLFVKRMIEYAPYSSCHDAKEGVLQEQLIKKVKAIKCKK